MKLQITGRNMMITPGITERVEKKTRAMSRYLPSDTEMTIRMSKNKNDIRKVEITVPLGGNVILRSEAEAPENLYLAIDQALMRMEKQIHRHRTKLDKKLREGAFSEVVPEYLEMEEPEESAVIVKRKTFTVRPMSEEDAIMQMELLGHDFFVFVNADTGLTNVIYTRKDKSLGILEPET